MKNVKSSCRHLLASCEFYMNRTECQTLVFDLLSTRLKKLSTKSVKIFVMQIFTQFEFVRNRC